MKYPGLPSSAAAHDRAVAELGAGAPPAKLAYVVLRPAEPYDLATSGTPLGLRQLAAAAAEGGAWFVWATLALALAADGAVVASLALRCIGDLPGRPRRAWAAYVRTEAEDGTVSWVPNGAMLADHGDAERPVRIVGILELKAVLRGEVYVPPPPRPGPPRFRCYHCDQVTPFSVATWKPYARHRCETTKQTEGRS